MIKAQCRPILNKLLGRHNTCFNSTRYTNVNYGNSCLSALWWQPSVPSCSIAPSYLIMQPLYSAELTRLAYNVTLCGFFLFVVGYTMGLGALKKREWKMQV